MVRLAHISDVHISSPAHTLMRMWTNKRLLGGTNMLLRRRHELRNDYFPPVLNHIQEHADYLLMSGDISTTSLHQEFEQAKDMLAPFLQDEKLVIIPGNHDTYTQGAYKQQRYESFFANYHGTSDPEHYYPFTRRLNDDIVVIGLNTCVPTGLGGAWGVIDRYQIERLPELLLNHSHRYRIIMLHHFLQDKHGTPGHQRRWIRNRDQLLRILRQYGAELIIHGHEHACYAYTVPGKNDKPIPVHNPGPATRHSKTPLHQGGYLLYEFAGQTLKQITRYCLDPDTFQLHPHPIASPLTPHAS